MSWWQRNRDVEAAPVAPVERPGDPLVFIEPDDEAQWTFIGELDRTGRWTAPPQQGWLHRIGGWRPLGEFLRERS
jgi:hypothetical protein